MRKLLSSGMTFEQSEYTDAVFTGLELPGLTLDRRRFYDCRFDECTLSEADLSGARFIDCSFTDCDLSMAKVSDAEFHETRFERCTLVGINWSVLARTTGQAAGLDFFDCVLKYATFGKLDLQGRSIVNCLAQEVEFSDLNLAEADLSGSDFSGSGFQRCNLAKANFLGAKNYLLDVRDNRVAGASFSLPEALGLLSGLGIDLH